MKPIRAAAAVGGMAILTACSIPTSAPKVQQQWVFPADSTTISVDEFLPSGVSVSGATFVLNVNPFTANEVLGNLCTLCTDGPTAAVPAFDATLNASQTLPTDVDGATLSSGSVDIAITNGFSFDPIAGGGTLTVTITDGPGGAQIGQMVLSGDSVALPPGTTLHRTMTLSPGAIGTTAYMSVEVKSVGGQAATVNTADALDVTATPGPLDISSATVNVASRSVNMSSVDLNVGSIDSSITDHILNGAIELTVANPFGVGLSGQLVINTPSGPITKTLTVSNGPTSTTTLSYSQAEFQQFLGQNNVTLGGTATVAASAGAITVTPGEQLSINTKVHLTIEIGG